ncbi:N-acetylmuramoyl-l-alanine amidase I [Citrobacter koseri]|nr:N-acetylmuramoyl-l-alanine amidase I [Citrobacter koseri]
MLEIAKNVRAILRNQGIDARLTRTGDTFIPLYDRVEIAHKHGADLFMSIHADGFTNPSAAGASVFALSNRGASSAMAKYLSDRENRADEVAGKKATDKDHLLQQVLFDLVQTDTIKNSLTLGSHILKKIKPVHRLHSRNTEQAAFVVLKSPSIPLRTGRNLIYHQPGRGASVRHHRIPAENRHRDSQWRDQLFPLV